MLAEEYEGERPDAAGALAVALLACCAQNPALITRAPSAAPPAPAECAPAAPSLPPAGETLTAA